MLRDALLRLVPQLERLPPDACVVGGAVRDLLLGVDPADVDIACSDPHACAEAVGGRLVHLGRGEIATWRVVTPAHELDFTTIDGASIEEDLHRRDFTVNGMAIELHTGRLIDLFGGQRDLADRIVRMIDPKNFDDDPLRMLKGVRLAVRRGFDIEPRTLDAIRQRAPKILDVAPERVTYELSLILDADSFRPALSRLRETELDEPVLGVTVDPSRYSCDAVPLEGALALLIDDPKAYGERWRWSDVMIRDTVTLQRLLAAKGDLRVALYDAGARVSGMLPPTLRALGRNEDAGAVERLLTAELFAASALLTGGEIAEAAGMAPGKQLGDVKRALLEAQIRGEVRSRDEALAFVRER